MTKELSPRQRQILELAAEGRTDKEIAHVSGLSEGTIRTYWDRLRRRYDARSRAEVVAKALIRPGIDVGLQMLLKLPLFVWTADNSGYVDFCNDWFTTYGCLPAGSAIGLGCRLLMPDDELEGSSERWRQAQETGLGYEALVHFRCGPSGQLIAHKIRLIPIKGVDGHITKWIGYGRELAENADEQMVRFLRALIGQPAR